VRKQAAPYTHPMVDIETRLVLRIYMALAGIAGLTRGGRSDGGRAAHRDFGPRQRFLRASAHHDDLRSILPLKAMPAERNKKTYIDPAVQALKRGLVSIEDLA